MRLHDLDLPELLELTPEGGPIFFAGTRALLVDATALGILRRELIETLGELAARCILTRFGYVHGWRTAENLEGDVPWPSKRDWSRAGGRLHTLQGQVVVGPLDWDESDGPAPLACCSWRFSYEAEQHRLQMGTASSPVCWTLCGFASGYLSRGYGRQVICIERTCAACAVDSDPGGKTDEAHDPSASHSRCEMIGRFLEDWPQDVIAPHLPFFEEDAIETVQKQASAALKRTEALLRSKRQELLEESEPFEGWVARSRAMARTLELVRRLGPFDATVLITGESGTGKERIARLLHDNSQRRQGPFCAINCGAMPDTLLESELFGHARGAFTGASDDREGLFEAANKGTLLLDEIGEASPNLQVKLLRVLQEGEIRRVGENRNRKVDVRVLAATHRDLVAEIEAGRFRQDLYYRLRVIEIPMPPARERRDDLLELARRFLADAAQRLDLEIQGFTPAAADGLLRYGWPGNIRELQNAIERAVILTSGPRIDLEDLPPEICRPESGPLVDPGPLPLQEVEQRHILRTLDHFQGNRERAAAALGIGTATLYRRLKAYGETG